MLAGYEYLSYQKDSGISSYQEKQCFPIKSQKIQHKLNFDSIVENMFRKRDWKSWAEEVWNPAITAPRKRNFEALLRSWILSVFHRGLKILKRNSTFPMAIRQEINVKSMSQLITVDLWGGRGCQQLQHSPRMEHTHQHPYMYMKNVVLNNVKFTSSWQKIKSVNGLKVEKWKKLLFSIFISWKVRMCQRMWSYRTIWFVFVSAYLETTGQSGKKWPFCNFFSWPK